MILVMGQIFSFNKKIVIEKFRRFLQTKLNDFLEINFLRIKGGIRMSGYNIFTVAFLLYPAPEGGCNPTGQIFYTAGHSLTLTQPKITHHPSMWKCEETRNFEFFPWPFSYLLTSIKWLKLTLNSEFLSPFHD